MGPAAWVRPGTMTRSGGPKGRGEFYFNYEVSQEERNRDNESYIQLAGFGSSETLLSAAPKEGHLNADIRVTWVIFQFGTACQKIVRTFWE